MKFENFRRLRRSAVLIVCLLACFLTFPHRYARGEEWPAVFDPFRVLTIHLEMDPADWDAVRFDSSLTVRKPAWMWDEGETNRILVQIKRKSDLPLPSATNPQKVSLKVDINEFVPGQAWRGLKKLSLENGNGGNSVVEEGFSWAMHRLASEQGFYGYPAGYAAWVTLFVNGNCVGVYTSAEERDKQFLQNRGMYREGATWLYKYDPTPTIEAGNDFGPSPTVEHLCFLPFSTKCSAPDLETDLPAWIQMEAMFTQGAIEAFTGNNDGLFTHNGKNSFALDYSRPDLLLRLYFPWDLDAGLGGSTTFNIYTGGPSGGNSNYQRYILGHYWFRQVYRHLMTDLLDGPLSLASLTAFLDRLEPVLTPALQSDPNLDITGIADHFAALRQWVTNRTANVRAQLGQVTGWPIFSRGGGEIVPGFALTLSHTNLAGSIFYTMDGRDPRAPGGAPAGTMFANGTPMLLTNTTHVRARVLSGTNWSALREQTYNVAHYADGLKVTEIMYHPRPPATNEDGDEYEFIEFKNTGASPIDMSGCFCEGIKYKFRAGTIIRPGEFFLLVRNTEAFARRYPGVVCQGVYFGALDNNGERIHVRNSEGNNIISLEYRAEPPWPLGPDGFGFSLVNQNPAGDPDDPENWRASAGKDGSPGADDPAPAYSTVLINEVLTHTDLPQEDAIEIYNPNGVPASIGGWYLSDQIDPDDASGSVLKKFRIPSGTVVPAGGYKVFYQAEFGGDTNLPGSFALSRYGDEVYLASADPAGNLTGFITGAAFGAAENGWSWGAFRTSAGMEFAPLAGSTFGADNATDVQTFRSGAGGPNTLPLTGPVVINEVMYHPATGGTEFIELRNVISTDVDLAGWSLRGAGDYVFPSGSVLAAGELLVMVGTTNTTVAGFRAAYSVPASVGILQHQFDLQNSGEALELRRPNDQPTNAPIRVDLVRFNDQGRWSEEADGAGPSLERFSSLGYGNEPRNWRVLMGAGSPGRAAVFTNLAAVARNTRWKYHSAGWNLGNAWRGLKYSDAGWPDARAPLGYGAAGLQTTLGNWSGTTGAPTTVYLRKDFVVNDPPRDMVSVELRVKYTDGFLAYINGVEVARRSLGPGAVSFDTWGAPHAAADYETIDLTAFTNSLAQGQNVLTVELHRAAGSADLAQVFWNAELVYEISGAPIVEVVHITNIRLNPEGGLLLEWDSIPGRLYRVQQSSDLLAWSDMDPVVTAPGITSRFTDPAAPVGTGRCYRIRSAEP